MLDPIPIVEKIKQCWDFRQFDETIENADEQQGQVSNTLALPSRGERYERLDKKGSKYDVHKSDES